MCKSGINISKPQCSFTQGRRGGRLGELGWWGSLGSWRAGLVGFWFLVSHFQVNPGVVQLLGTTLVFAGCRCISPVWMGNLHGCVPCFHHLVGSWASDGAMSTHGVNRSAAFGAVVGVHVRVFPFVMQLTAQAASLLFLALV